jgi:hypothetical protein
MQITTLITVAVILSLSVVIGERLKDTSVSGSVMTIKGSTQPIQVGLSRQYRWGYLGNTQGVTGAVPRQYKCRPQVQLDNHQAPASIARVGVSTCA